MGILRADRVSGLGGANAINGSVKFSTNSQPRVLEVHGAESNEDFRLSNGSFTIEFWANVNDQTNSTFLGLFENSPARRSWIFEIRSNQALRFEWWTDGSNGSNLTSSTGVVSLGAWHHYAIVRNGTALNIYVDGTSVANTTTSDTLYDNTVEPLIIGGNSQGGTLYAEIDGYISNLRIIKGEAIYTSAFTVPAQRLEKTDNTVLLCCQSPGDVTQEATDKTIVPRTNSTAVAWPEASHFAPDVGEDHGTTLGDNTKFDTLSYMVPPGGTTAESNRGRGVFGGGYTSVPGDAMVKRIYYIQIDSMGTSAEFGDLSVAKYGVGGNSSSTRGLFNGGTTPTNLNTIEYITIATTSNALDFGDLNVQHGYTASCSNNTRGLTGGGRGGSPTASVAQIDYNTIATLGNGADFGDLTQARMGLGAFESSTRGVFCGGSNSPTSPATVYNIIDYVTIATTGNATDFGDMTAGHDFHGTASSSTRGIIYGGITSYGPSVRTNIIEYVTIASTGNGTDFGDVRDDGAHAHGTSNSIRGVFAGGIDPYRNSIDFITIATTGDGVDWGDLPIETGSYAYAAGLSDSHGGIS